MSVARTDGKALERAPIAAKPVYSIVSEPPGRRNTIGDPQTPHPDALEVQLRESRLPCRVGYASGRLLPLLHNLVRIPLRRGGSIALSHSDLPSPLTGRFGHRSHS
jgi:hypothetical protein